MSEYSLVKIKVITHYHLFHMKRIKNKVALVTGASSGIGKETVKQLLADGAIVYAAARRTERMSDLETLGAHVVSLDVTDEDSTVACVDTVIGEQHRLDILINNAGYGSYGAVEDVPLDEARRQFDVNLFGLARVTQLALPHMRKHSYGKIVNISSIGGKIYAPLGAWYHATKHALEGWSDALRFETSPFGINVIIIEPGGIKTEWGDIAEESLLERSGEGAYQKMAHQVAALLRDTYEKGKGSPPEVIAKLISKAVNAKRPQARYHGGYMAGVALSSRWLLSDKLFDQFMKLQIKR